MDNIEKLTKQELVRLYKDALDVIKHWQEMCELNETKSDLVVELASRNKVLERALELVLKEYCPEYDAETRSHWIEDVKEEYIEEAEKELANEQ